MVTDFEAIPTVAIDGEEVCKTLSHYNTFSSSSLSLESTLVTH